MDQWLDAAPSTVSLGKAVDSLKTEKKKKKKKHLSPSRELYEEASGVCTPSNPYIDISPKLSMQALGPVKLGTNADLVVVSFFFKKNYKYGLRTTKPRFSLRNRTT